MARPVMLVVAGPPGSGKTMFFPASALGVDAFNIDDRCAQLLGSYRAIPQAVRSAVSRECERFVLRHIQDGRSFAVETTLRTLTAARQAEMAAQHGFRTELRFLATASPDLNVQRVRQRAYSGGHAASESEIRATYAASVENLPEATRAFLRSKVYDTSEPWTRPRLVATARSGMCDVVLGAPDWVVRALGGKPPE